MEKTEGRSGYKRRGTHLGIFFFKCVVRLFGLGVAYVWLYPVCLYYLVFDGKARRGGCVTMSRRFPGAGRWGLLLHTYRLFVMQGRQLINRFAYLSNSCDFEFDLRGRETVEAGLTREKGAIVLTAHVGNWQITLPTLAMFGRRVSVVMLPEFNNAVKSLVKDSDEINTISSAGPLGGVVEIINTVCAGGLVAMMGDRIYDFDGIEVDFLGSKALFPYGAFMVAASQGVPVIVLTSSQDGDRSYVGDVSRVIYPTYSGRTDKKKQLQPFVQQYADILSEFIEEKPYQFFLFQDIWK